MTNQEILFRGFHPCEDGDTTIYVEGEVVKGEWVEGMPINKCRQIIVSCFDIKHLKDEDCMILKGVIHKVIPSTVGQYTTRDDKNGRKIFKGDIVKENDTIHDGEIQIIGKEYQAIFSDGAFYFWKSEQEYIYFPNSKKYEVIGTIFDKPKENTQCNQT